MIARLIFLMLEKIGISQLIDNVFSKMVVFFLQPGKPSPSSGTPKGKESEKGLKTTGGHPNKNCSR